MSIRSNNSHSQHLVSTYFVPGTFLSVLRALLTLTIPVSLGIVAFLIPISQIGRWSLGQVQGLVLVPMDSEWRGRRSASMLQQIGGQTWRKYELSCLPQGSWGCRLGGKESELSATGCFCSGKAPCLSHLLALQSWPLCPEQ